MAANALVEPLAEAPDRPFVELFARLGRGDSIGRLLVRSGVSYAEAGAAARLIAAEVPGLTGNTSSAKPMPRTR